MCEATAVSITRAACQFDGFHEVHPHFAGRVRIRSEGDRHAHLRRQNDDLSTRIDFFAVFAQSGGVEFHGHIFSFGGFEKAFEERRAILRRIEAEFLAQVSVRDGFEKPGFGRQGKPLEVSAPDFIRIALFPFRDFFWVVQVPGVRNVMHRADEVIPRMPRGEVA